MHILLTACLACLGGQFIEIHMLKLLQNVRCYLSNLPKIQSRTTMPQTFFIRPDVYYRTMDYHETQLSTCMLNSYGNGQGLQICSVKVGTRHMNTWNI
ncbi:hypothetical protein GGR54DRAFT_20085 [Hypoxylon sp. NC1633]|nr:hypothetical protein GGR54DRAFT_20085 [Hypoxylon sp. NC1633]